MVLQNSNQALLTRAMRQAQESLRAARAGQSGQGGAPLGTPLHVNNPILQS